jgi:hypothetical protein
MFQLGVHRSWHLVQLSVSFQKTSSSITEKLNKFVLSSAECFIYQARLLGDRTNRFNSVFLQVCDDIVCSVCLSCNVLLEVETAVQCSHARRYFCNLLCHRFQWYLFSQQ